MDLSLFLPFKMWRKLDTDGRCSELSVDFCKNTSTIIEMLAIKVGTPSYLELFMKREEGRERQRVWMKEDKTVICVIIVSKQKQTFYNYLDRPTARCMIKAICYQPL